MAKAVKAAVHVALTWLLYAVLATMVWRHVGWAVLLLAWGLCFASPLHKDDVSCHSASATPYRYYSTHTDYEDVRGHGEDFTLAGCTPRKFYMFSRHGIRYPTTGSFLAMYLDMPKIQSFILNHLVNGTLCEKEQAAIRNWRFGFDESKAELLSDTGRKESYDLGERYSHRFPELLGQPYSPERYQFEHTYKSRTRDTAKAIAEGMFNASDFHMDVNPRGHDPILRFYDICDKYQMTVKRQPLVEQNSFQTRPEVKNVFRNVIRRLGVPDEGFFTFGHVALLAELCSFEHSILRSSPWCAIFSTEDLKVLEYWKDLKYYWAGGYGHSINYEQTCDLIKDLMGYLKDSSSNVTGMIRVGHDTGLMPLIARLGAFRDTKPLKANNMVEQRNRKWRSSLIASFGSNIAFVKYQCGSEYKVRVFHDEKPLALPMCPESGCPLSSITDSYLGSFATNCDFKKTCAYDPNSICEGHVTHTGSCVPTIIG